MAIQQYSKLYPLDYEWLWQDAVVVSEVTMLAGDSGAGKGYLVADIVARVTTGRDMHHDDTLRDPASVIMIGLEEDKQCTTVHKLTAAGADLSRVFDLSEIDTVSEFSRSGNKAFTIQEDLGSLKQALADQMGEVALVVLDPLSAVSSKPLTALTSRQIMSSLRTLARDAQIAILVVHHPVKGRSAAGGTGLSIKDRIGGSKSLTDAARLVLGLDKDAETNERVLSIVKSNICDDQAPPRRFKLAGDWPMRVTWIEDTEEDHSNDDDDSEPAPNTEAGKLLAALRALTEPVNGKQLAYRAEVNGSTARVSLARLVDKKLAIKLERGLYLAARPEITVGEPETVTEQPTERTPAPDRKDERAAAAEKLAADDVIRQMEESIGAAAATGETQTAEAALATATELLNEELNKELAAESTQ